MPGFSERSDTHAPPGFGLEGLDLYGPARSGFAHGTASWVAENDCSVLRAEAVYLRRLAYNQLLAIADKVAELGEDAAAAFSGWSKYSPGSNSDRGTGFYKQAADINHAAYIEYAADKTGAAQQLMEAAGKAETMLRDAAGKLPAVTDDLTTQGRGCANVLAEDSNKIRRLPQMR